MEKKKKISLPYDVAKCITNVQANGVTVKGIVKWKHLRTFYSLDKDNPNFVFAPALSDQHLANSKQKMRVGLAVQVFSHSVASGLMSKFVSAELPSEALATATISHKFDELFHALNADIPDWRRGKKQTTNMNIWMALIICIIIF